MQLPEEFIRYTRELMGEALFAQLLRGLAEEPPVSIRINPLKCYHMPLGIDCRVPWCNTGYYLTSRPNFTFDPLLHAGLYYVQEASSMFIHHVLRQLCTEPVTVLDLCAAPGGKSTAARTVLPKGSLLVSNEPVRQRASVLAENMQKFGHRDVVVTNNLPRDFQRSGLTFDVVMADVPCSGEGMFRKDAAAVGEWSPQNVERCSRLQRDIVADVWPCLKPGGLLVYSTCTFNAHENEENVRWICRELGAEALPVAVEPEWQLTGSLLADFQAPVYRFLPGKSRGEGLFVAVLRKAGASAPRTATPPTQPPTTMPATPWLDGSFTLTTDADRTLALSPAVAPFYAAAVKRGLRIVHAGITLGSRKGRGADLQPHQSLALAAALSPTGFPRAELAYTQAVSYLRREAVALPAETPRGYVIVTYHGVPLGFVKNLGTRANNLYPQEWRIKSTHAPAEEPKVIEK